MSVGHTKLLFSAMRKVGQLIGPIWCVSLGTSRTKNVNWDVTVLSSHCRTNCTPRVGNHVRHGRSITRRVRCTAHLLKQLRSMVACLRLPQWHHHGESHFACQIRGALVIPQLLQQRRRRQQQNEAHHSGSRGTQRLRGYNVWQLQHMFWLLCLRMKEQCR